MRSRVMRRFTLFLILLLASTGPSLYAQNALVLYGLHSNKIVRHRAHGILNVGPRSAWAGAQVAYKVAGSGDFDDRFQVAGQVALQYWKKEPIKVRFLHANIEFPFLGNLAVPKPDIGEDALAQKAQELLASAEGIHFGLAPNLLWSLGKSGNYGIAGWGYLGFRTNAAKTQSDETIYLDQLRWAIGAELIIGEFRYAQKPGSIGFEVIGLSFDEAKYSSIFGTARSKLTAFEGTAVLPLADQFALMGQYVTGIGDVKEHSWRVGLVLNPSDRATPSQ